MSLPSAVIRGNILTIFRNDMVEIVQFVIANKLEVFSVIPYDKGFEISTPINRSLEDNAPGLLHGARARLNDQLAKEQGFDDLPPSIA